MKVRLLPWLVCLAVSLEAAGYKVAPTAGSAFVLRSVKGFEARGCPATPDTCLADAPDTSL